MEELVKKVAQWHHDRNLIEGATDKDQFCKLIQEAGELSDNICKGKDMSDDIGDMIVVLINIAERNNLTLKECLEIEYRISQKMVNRHDFGEGIEAVLIEKHHNPRWEPNSIKDIIKDDLEKIFSSTIDNELKL